MRIKSLLNLILYFQTICLSYAYLWPTFPTTLSDPSLIAENLVLSSRPKNGPKIKLKSRHSQQRMQMTYKPIVQTNIIEKSVTKRFMKSIASEKEHNFNQLKPKIQSPAIKGRKIYGKRRKKTFQDSNIRNSTEIIDSYESEINLLKNSEQSLLSLMPRLQSLDQRIGRLYKTSRRRRLYFFDLILLKTQKFIKSLVNSANDQISVMKETPNKLNWISSKGKPMKKSLQWKQMDDQKLVKQLINNVESLKNRIIKTNEEIDSALNEFVQEFNIKEDKTFDS